MRLFVLSGKKSQMLHPSTAPVPSSSSAKCSHHSKTPNTTLINYNSKEKKTNKANAVPEVKILLEDMRAAGDHTNDIPLQVTLCITDTMKRLYIRRTPIRSTNEKGKKKKVV